MTFLGQMAAASTESQAPVSRQGAHLDGSQIGPLRMVLIMTGLWIGLFLSALETTIIATAFRRISNDLNDLSQSTWIVVAYLLTYNGFLLLFSKLTDIFGPKSLLILAESIFLVFSMACGGAQTMTQLVVFRALQGIGGSGIYSVVFVIVGKISTVEKIGLYTGILSSVFALASLLGPILGGVIIDNTTWRWVFFLNGPGIVLSFLFIVPAIPKLDEALIEKDKLRRVDVIGALLSLAWPTMLVFALEEAGQVYAWDSSQVIGTLAGSGVSLVAFGFYEIWVQRKGRQEPIFPVKFLKDPMLSLNILTMFTMGCCFYAAIILLPQRFQAVNGISAAQAGITMLPFTILSPFFSMVCGMLLSKVPRCAALVLVCSSSITIAGITLLGSLSTMSVPLSITPKVYGFEVILAVGLGFMMPPLLFFIKVDYDGADLAAAMGAINTARTLGGCVAVAICSTILHANLSSSLQGFLSPDQVEAVLGSTANTGELSASETTRVQQAYGQSYDTQFRALIAFAGASFISSVMLWIVQYTRQRVRVQ